MKMVDDLLKDNGLVIVQIIQNVEIFLDVFVVNFDGVKDFMVNILVVFELFFSFFICLEMFVGEGECLFVVVFLDSVMVIVDDFKKFLGSFGNVSKDIDLLMVDV